MYNVSLYVFRARADIFFVRIGLYETASIYLDDLERLPDLQTVSGRRFTSEVIIIET